jgi:prepilin-type processing-associated H-X9-DG protein
VKGQRWANNFEQGCGGYGYNMAYLGSRLWQAALPFKERYARTANISEVRRPSETLVFADCAMSRRAGDYIEYSFAEPPHPLVSGKVLTDMYTSPSVHFRHKKWANIGWADGHIDLREMAQFEEKNVYNVVSMNMKLGWFEPIDNSLFDLE